MRLNVTADSVKVDDDEGRIILVVATDEGDTVTIDIHGVAFEFYANVRTQLGPYAHEAQLARDAVAAGMPLDEYLGPEPRTIYRSGAAAPQIVTNRPVSVEDAIDAGYALDDPKSPGFHDRMVD